MSKIKALNSVANINASSHTSYPRTISKELKELSDYANTFIKDKGGINDVQQQYLLCMLNRLIAITYMAPIKKD